jgi:hypothetical protein
MGGRRSMGGYSLEQATWDWLVGGFVGFCFGFIIYIIFIR